jgi:hypothetical protein
MFTFLPSLSVRKKKLRTVQTSIEHTGILHLRDKRYISIDRAVESMKN